DPAEVEFRFGESAIFHDLESGRQLYVDPHTARERYLQRFAEHAAAIDRACTQLGIDSFQLGTDQPLELALFDFLNSRLRRGRQMVRRRSRPSMAGGG
ncbi:MAG TPA: DUF58 domain-containing protein, partial [Pirellulales bacterium]|nr:DUF58 domain-containing protein [Pirellulales bacterium]